MCCRRERSFFLSGRCRARATYSLGASGAVFGLFAVAVLLKLRFNLQKLVECLVLGQFVVNEVLQVGRSTAELLLHPLLSGDLMAAVHF